MKRQLSERAIDECKDKTKQEKERSSYFAMLHLSCRHWERAKKVISGKWDTETKTKEKKKTHKPLTQASHTGNIHLCTKFGDEQCSNRMRKLHIKLTVRCRDDETILSLVSTHKVTAVEEKREIFPEKKKQREWERERAGESGHRECSKSKFTRRWCNKKPSTVTESISVFYIYLASASLRTVSNVASFHGN